MASTILFLVPYPLKESPSQRFRFEQYFEILEENGHQFEVQSFLDSQNWRVFFKRGKTLRKAIALFKGFLKRLLMLFKCHKYDLVFIHREAAPVGPPVIEWFIARVLKKKVIYDFDDAIWGTDRAGEAFLLRIIKWRSKVGLICKWSYKVSCGNEYLQRYALQYNRNAVINPTTIDTGKQHNISFAKKSARNGVVIGWTGSHSTLKYLKEIENVLQKLLANNTNVEIAVIADRIPQLSFPFTFIQWKVSSELEDLLTFDIGIMPLPDDEWSKGKCGFKILQYMALKVPAVASPVGVNTEIISEGINGFLCRNESEWLLKLQLLIDDEGVRMQLGEAGYRTLNNRYSVHSNALNFLKLFK